MVCVSLLSPCVLRLRRKAGVKEGGMNKRILHIMLLALTCLALTFGGEQTATA